ncbi:hypothetical protein [Poriferisphaera sp. WC338]|uniref:hypothetical protein n=1 Tax=Poriferisphaera sp. WC338 TaxID=3425129 RepID=UPI003D813C63
MQQQRQRFALLTLLMIIILGSADLLAAPKQDRDTKHDPQTETIHVLWVGNSYSFAGPLPNVVQTLMTEGKTKYRMEFGKSFMGGKGYKYHVEDGKAMKKIAEGWKDEDGNSGAWDYVVLQNKSWGPVSQQDEMREYGKILADAAQAVGAEPIYYCTWAKRHHPEQAQTIFDVYQELADTNGGKVAPAGQAWKLVYETADKHGIELYRFDRSHPSSWGVYLNACVFYATLTGESPVGLKLRKVSPWKTTERYTKAHLKNRPGLKLTEKDLYNGERTLSKKEINLLQKAAWKAVQSQQKLSESEKKREAETVAP